jgi:L-2-hydroxyglutarate oxidase LhgO
VNETDCVVIGAGVIGLAVARVLSVGGRDVIILECERQFGMHLSSRNSEVIHAGIHYSPDSLKARLCVSGKELLYRYCAQRRIEHRRCGKFTVATAAAQIQALEDIERNARASGVLDLEWRDESQMRRAEPELRCVAALYSPSTGIIDSHGYMQTLLADAQQAGAEIVFGTEVTGLRATKHGIDIFIDQETSPVLRARNVVNSAGLEAHRVARSIEGFPRAKVPDVHYAKGSYFALSGAAPFSHLVYPAPTPDGHLGVHMTLDLAGRARFGPDMEWVEKIDYAVDPKRAGEFAAAIKSYWPRLDAARLLPAYAGVRPKISRPGEAARDFMISGPKDHGVAGIVNLFGMDSPGLTASLAIAETVSRTLA